MDEALRLDATSAGRGRRTPAKAPVSLLLLLLNLASLLPLPR
jgi:hypothetical protein